MRYEDLVDIHGEPIPLNQDGTLTVFYRTSATLADIRRHGFLSGENTDEIFVSTRQSGYATGYGQTVIVLRINPHDARLDDAFEGEIHLAIPRYIANAALKDTEHAEG